jgi:hypothetical protein
MKITYHGNIKDYPLAARYAQDLKPHHKAGVTSLTYEIELNSGRVLMWHGWFTDAGNITIYCREK